MKYVVEKDKEGNEIFSMTSEASNHTFISLFQENVISAGFSTFLDSEQQFTHGESILLKKKANPEKDDKRLKTFLEKEFYGISYKDHLETVAFSSDLLHVGKFLERKYTYRMKLTITKDAMKIVECFNMTLNKKATEEEKDIFAFFFRYVY